MHILNFLSDNLSLKGALSVYSEFSEENTYIRTMAVKMTSKLMIFTFIHYVLR